MMKPWEEACGLLDERAAVYRFLAGFYMRECQDDYLDALAAQGLPDEGDGRFARGCRAVNDYLQSAVADRRQELACDYAKVFLGAGIYDGTSASPFESVYASEEKILMQEPRDEVYALFLREGIEPRQEDGAFLPEDHLSFELAYMARCCAAAKEALEAGDGPAGVEYLAKQEAFLRDHLERWLPSFCEDVRTLARTGFYYGLADVTEGFVSDDRERVAALRQLVEEGC